MLNRIQLKNYRELRGLSTRDVAGYCDISQPLIVQVENGTKSLTKHNHDEIIKGINEAYKAKQSGEFVKSPYVNEPKSKRNRKAGTKE